MTAACIATTGSGGELQMGNRCVVVPVHDCHQVLSSVQSSGCYELSKITVSISSQLRCEKLFPVNSVAAAVMMARIGRLPLVCAYMILVVACTSVHAIPLGFVAPYSLGCQSLTRFSRAFRQFLPIPEKVSVEFYEESLCPYCAAFIKGALKEFVESPLIEISDFRIIPYGNAVVAPNGTIVCQHGVIECAGNLIEACAVHFYPAVSTWYPFVECIAGDYSLESTAPACAEKAGLEWSKIEECYLGPLGDKLIRTFASETDALEPAHQYVPWLLVNGAPSYEDYEDVLSLVCKAYKGPPPAYCNTKVTKRTNGLKGVSPRDMNAGALEQEVI